VRETETISETLAMGYLPYTGLPQLSKNSYYLARSLRVKTAPFQLSSENRRVFRKLEDIQIECTLIDKAGFDWTPENIDFCLQYANSRFSSTFSPERFQQILDHSHGNKLMRMESEGRLVGLVLLGADDTAWHYWFAFFALDFATNLPFGKWAMTQSLELASQNGLEYVYLGTCYGAHSLYKVRDFKGISYFDGNQWSEDSKALKELCKQDQNIDLTDLIKKHEDNYSYLK
jgi:arginyl-tRNA--protein-N-Asp/Glu arginylyltransferase